MKIKTKIENPERQIQVILDGFDFGQVHKAMVALDWKWHMDAPIERVPSVADLKKESGRLLNKIVKSLDKDGDTNWISTGGFKAGHDGYGNLTLAFEIESGEYVPGTGGDPDYFGLS